MHPEAVLPERVLCLPTFSHFLIVNKTSLFLSLSGLSLSSSPICHTAQARPPPTPHRHRCHTIQPLPPPTHTLAPLADEIAENTLSVQPSSVQASVESSVKSSLLSLVRLALPQIPRPSPPVPPSPPPLPPRTRRRRSWAS